MHIANILFLALQAASSSSESMGLTMNPPAGWTSLDVRPARAFSAPELKPGEVLTILVIPADKLRRVDFATWFGQRLVEPGTRVLQQSAIESRPANGLQTLITTQRATLASGGTVVRLFYGISSGTRVTLAVMVASHDALVSRYAPVVQQFLEGIAFDDAPVTSGSPVAPPLNTPNASPPAATGAPASSTSTPIPPARFNGAAPEGFYFRVAIRFGNTEVETRALIFLPAGRIARLFPFSGADVLDLSRCQSLPDSCGTYSMRGDQIAIRWNDGNTQQVSFVRTAQGFDFDGDRYRPARVVAERDVVGEWYSPGDVRAGRLTASLRFAADGTFSWGVQSTRSGRYEIRGLVLTLRFLDGTAKRYTLFGALEGDPVTRIGLDNEVYWRK